VASAQISSRRAPPPSPRPPRLPRQKLAHLWRLALCTSSSAFLYGVEQRLRPAAAHRSARLASRRSDAGRRCRCSGRGAPRQRVVARECLLGEFDYLLIHNLYDSSRIARYELKRGVGLYAGLCLAENSSTTCLDLYLIVSRLAGGRLLGLLAPAARERGRSGCPGFLTSHMMNSKASPATSRMTSTRAASASTTSLSAEGWRRSDTHDQHVKNKARPPHVAGIQLAGVHGDHLFPRSARPLWPYDFGAVVGEEALCRCGR